MQYQKEFYYAGLLRPDGSARKLCITPDLATVVDAAGSANGTNNLRYGMLVTVLLTLAPPLWTTEQGLRMASPRAIGVDEDYLPLEGDGWREARSVTEEAGVWMVFVLIRATKDTEGDLTTPRPLTLIGIPRFNEQPSTGCLLVEHH